MRAEKRQGDEEEERERWKGIRLGNKAPIAVFIYTRPMLAQNGRWVRLLSVSELCDWLEREGDQGHPEAIIYFWNSLLFVVRHFLFFTTTYAHIRKTNNLFSRDGASSDGRRNRDIRFNMTCDGTLEGRRKYESSGETSSN
jgi:hypothetical protein